jgi:hypothetical protein
MAKGFGTQPKKLGYVLLLYPKGRGYAARHSLTIPTMKPSDEDEDFIGITSMLEEAQRWKHQRDAQKAVELYMTFILDLIDKDDEAEVKVRRLERSSDGSLSTETIVELTFSRP